MENRKNHQKSKERSQRGQGYDDHFFANNDGFIYQNVVSTDHTVTAARYQDTSKKMIQHFRKKRPEKSRRNRCRFFNKK